MSKQIEYVSKEIQINQNTKHSYKKTKRRKKINIHSFVLVVNHHRFEFVGQVGVLLWEFGK